MKKITCSHDTDVPVEEWPVRPYSKSELARAYAPEIGERSALNRLSRWLHGRPVNPVRIFSYSPHGVER